MNCTEARDDLPELACGNLSGERRTRLEEHLDACPACRRELDALRQVSQLLRATPAPAASVEIETVYREAARCERLRLRRWRRLALSACVAAALLLLVFGLNLEVRMERHQVVLRWGAPPEEKVVLVPAPAPAPRDDGRIAAHEKRLRALNDLLLLLVADVQALDVRQQMELTRLRGEVARLRQHSALQWEAAERDVAALYAERFLTKKGEKR